MRKTALLLVLFLSIPIIIQAKKTNSDTPHLGDIRRARVLLSMGFHQQTPDERNTRQTLHIFK